MKSSMKRIVLSFKRLSQKPHFKYFKLIQIWFKFERHTSYSTHSAYILTHTALDANPAYSLRFLKFPCLKPKTTSLHAWLRKIEFRVWGRYVHDFSKYFYAHLNLRQILSLTKI